MEAEEYRTNFLFEDSYWWFTGRRRIVDNVLASWAERTRFSRILDAGCGTGKMVEFLSSFGKAFGVELSSEGINFSRRRELPFLTQGNVCELPFRSDSFDLVSCFDVLYHREVNEKKALAELYRVCAPGGFLVVTDAAFEFLRSEHDESVHGVRRYTQKSLRCAVEQAGFITVKSSYWNFFLFPVVVIVRLVKNILPRDHIRPVSNLKPLASPLNKLLSLLIYIEAKLMRLTSLPVGTSVILLARKGQGSHAGIEVL